MESDVSSGRCHGGDRQFIVGRWVQPGNGVRICGWRYGAGGRFVNLASGSPDHALGDYGDAQTDISCGRCPIYDDFAIATGRCQEIGGTIDIA